MSQGVGLQGSIWSNNLKSIFLLASFPFVLLAMLWAFLLAFNLAVGNGEEILWKDSIDKANIILVGSFGYVLLGVGIWFTTAWFSHQSLINKETQARPLERRENPKVYNLLENLCISRGLKMPKLFIIDSDILNAYASGINEKTYAITLTQGIINKLEDEELEAVIAHELSHIMNRDVRLLIISIIFVGIISMISEMIVRGVTRGAMGGRGSGKKGGGHLVMILIFIAVAAIGYLLSILIRFTL
jgi:heat shock protein HtpX